MINKKEQDASISLPMPCVIKNVQCINELNNNFTRKQTKENLDVIWVGEVIKYLLHVAH